MYYEEKIIDGVLCKRYSPTGDWIPFTPEELTRDLQRIQNRYERQQNYILKLTKQLDHIRTIMEEEL